MRKAVCCLILLMAAPLFAPFAQAAAPRGRRVLVQGSRYQPISYRRSRLQRRRAERRRRQLRRNRLRCNRGFRFDRRDRRDRRRYHRGTRFYFRYDRR